MPYRYFIVGITAVAAMWMYIDRVCFSTLAGPMKTELLLPLAPTPSPDDQLTQYDLKVAKNAKAKLEELSKLKGAEFDKAYVANEVAYHKAVDSALETTLIPSASNAELKSLLQTGLKIFQGHEQHAEHVAAELK